MLERLIEQCLPTIISACELMGIFVVAVTALRAFWLYCAGLVSRRPRNIKFYLADGLATSLAAEILKTVLVRDLNELMVLGAVILLRALLSLLIHIEMKGEHRAAQGDEDKEEP